MNRNSKCSCNSGLKYKHCCYKKKFITPTVVHSTLTRVKSDDGMFEKRIRDYKATIELRRLTSSLINEFNHTFR
jgi:hypothetical protein